MTKQCHCDMGKANARFDDVFSSLEADGVLQVEHPVRGGAVSCRGQQAV